MDIYLLLYRLISHNTDGKLYFARQSLLSDTVSCIELMHGCRTNFFANKSGVRQGDPLSPTLFGLFINDLARRMKEDFPVIQVGDAVLNCLLYTDDMVLIADSDDNLQSMLNKMFEWCSRWRLKVNKDKNKTMHFRKQITRRTQYNFQFGGICLK